MTINRQFRVLADYEVSDLHPLVLDPGTDVKVIRNDTSWPGWSWVEAGKQAGWIPDAFLDETATETERAFNGADLSAKRGDILDSQEDAPGWIFAKNASGETGWFPLFNLKPCQ